MPRTRRRRRRLRRRRGGSIVGLVASTIPTALNFARNILRNGTSWGVAQKQHEQFLKHNRRQIHN